jgi:hypothetical protein
MILVLKSHSDTCWLSGKGGLPRPDSLAESGLQ